MSCRANHLPHSTMVTGEDTLLSWWNVASRGPRAYGYVLLVVLTFSRSTLFSAHPSLSSPSLLKVPRHVFGDTAQNCIVASSLVACAPASPAVHGGLLDCTFFPRFTRGNYGIFLWFILAPCSRYPVTIRFGIIFAHIHQRCSRRFRRLQSCTQTVARCRRTVGQREQTLSGTTANMVVRFRAFSWCTESVERRLPGPRGGLELFIVFA